MNKLLKIREILSNMSLSMEDKLIEISGIVPPIPPRDFDDLVKRFSADDKLDVEKGQRVYLEPIGYVDFPVLKNAMDIFYCGDGVYWDVDLEGRKYWKKYNSGIDKGDNSRYSHLNDGDIVDEIARTRLLFKTYLGEIGIKIV